MKTFTKDQLIKNLVDIQKRGWIKSKRQGNAGGIVNTLEDLLGIEENNLPIPNAAEWELKCHRIGSTSLTTLFHSEPSPRALRFVPQVLLPKYGWPHQEAGEKYEAGEMSFRQTIHGNSRSDRGFKVVVDRSGKKVLISFDSASVDERHSAWLKTVKNRIGLKELEPQPYWGFDDLHHKAGTKLLNCFYVEADVKKENKNEYFNYSKIMMLQSFNFDRFLKLIDEAAILVDFDARTGHNHGTKFRLRQDRIVDLYDKATIIT